MPPNKKPLTDLERNFVDCYENKGFTNVMASMIEAGYKPKTAKCHGKGILERPRVIHAIELRQRKTKAKTIATRKQRQAFWTAQTDCTTNNLSDRLRASELLGRSECDFVQVQANLNADIPQEPEAYRAWLKAELRRMDQAKVVGESYAKSKAAIAERY